MERLAWASHCIQRQPTSPCPTPPSNIPTPAFLSRPGEESKGRRFAKWRFRGQAFLVFSRRDFCGRRGNVCHSAIPLRECVAIQGLSAAGQAARGCASMLRRQIVRSSKVLIERDVWRRRDSRIFATLSSPRQHCFSCSLSADSRRSDLRPTATALFVILCISSNVFIAIACIAAR